ncbi:MAG TPA: hypothetical protein ENI99_05465 [Sedimenticola sp.]|nr:hypothetical protein [Sedimenticola sp.]
MKEQRSATQILFGFLPEQTVDLKGGVWKVKEWRTPMLRSEVDDESLRRELIRQAMPWHNTGKDGGFVQNLLRGWGVRVYSVDKSNGVKVEPFPRLYMCKSCRRLHRTADARCQCGAQGRLGQLPFVGYHDACGNLKEPWIRPCTEHNQVRVNWPGTASSSEIVFDCPVCKKTLQRGFGARRCDCGDGFLSFNVHRSSSVYTPKSVVIVNPPSEDKIRRITQVGGPPKALDWVLEGMQTRTIDEAASLESLRRQLLDNGLPESVVEDMLEKAKQSGSIRTDGPSSRISSAQREEAENQSVTIALAFSESRQRVEDLIAATEPSSELGALYRDQYRLSMKQAGIQSVDLVEKFPVMTGNFAYLRGDGSPEKSRLTPFRKGASRDYVIYGEIAQTEALFVRLDPVKVLRWLVVRGHGLEATDDPLEARLRILGAARMPELDASSALHGVGTDLLTLVHTFTHRFIRIAAVYAGIDRDALSELLVPLHLGFFVYAAARGDFVLGGLQAVFETELDKLLHAFVHDDHRCPLDPGCIKSGGACMACVHLGEPSCRFFNRFLDRSLLSGDAGYLFVS